MEDIKIQVQENVAIVTIDRPPVNALRSQTYFELFQAFDTMAMDNKIRCVVLTAAGDKAFAAGADIREFLPLDSHTGGLFTSRNTGIRESIRNFPNPIICAINGMALGGGAVLALMCDIRIACEEARFGLPEINLGLIGGTQYIASYVPPGIAKLLTYTGEIISAKEAHRVGIYDIIMQRSELLGHCLEMAGKICSKPPLSIRLAKKALNYAYACGLNEGLVLEKALLEKLWGTEDKNEAVKAFLDKRPATFTGK